MDLNIDYLRAMVTSQRFTEVFTPEVVGLLIDRLEAAEKEADRAHVAVNSLQYEIHIREGES